MLQPSKHKGGGLQDEERLIDDSDSGQGHANPIYIPHDQEQKGRSEDSKPKVTVKRRETSYHRDSTSPAQDKSNERRAQSLIFKEQSSLPTVTDTRSFKGNNDRDNTSPNEIFVEDRNIYSATSTPVDSLSARNSAIPPLNDFEIQIKRNSKVQVYDEDIFPVRSTENPEIAEEEIIDKKLKYREKYGFTNMTELNKLRKSFDDKKITETEINDLRNRKRTTIDNNVEEGCEVSLKRNRYKHHAVVINLFDDDMVEIVHLTGNFKDSLSGASGSGTTGADKASASKDKVCRKHINYVYTYKGSVAFENDLVSLRAKFLYGIYYRLKEKKNASYNLLSYNCQHFASYCTTGTDFCKQIGHMPCCLSSNEINIDLAERINAMARDILDECKTTVEKEQKETNKHLRN